jgi:hypothetical protein
VRGQFARRLAGGRNGKEIIDSHDVPKLENGQNGFQGICQKPPCNDGKRNAAERKLQGDRRHWTQDEEMKLQDYREVFYTYSGKASEITRQLALAGIAIIWIFKKGDATTALTIPHELIWPGILILISLALDLSQYFLASAIWRLYYRKNEKAGIDEDAELPRHDPRLEWPIWAIYCVKVLCMIAAYVLILRYLTKALSFS